MARARAVDHATDGTVELDVVQFEARSFDFERIFFVQIAQLGEIFMAIERVIVKGHFCVESDQFAVARDDQRIDLGERRIGFVERAMQAIAGTPSPYGHRQRRQAQAEDDLPHLARLAGPSPGASPFAQDRVGIAVAATSSISRRPPALAMMTERLERRGPPETLR